MWLEDGWCFKENGCTGLNSDCSFFLQGDSCLLGVFMKTIYQAGDVTSTRSFWKNKATVVYVISWADIRICHRALRVRDDRHVRNLSDRSVGDDRLADANKKHSKLVGLVHK